MAAILRIFPRQPLHDHVRSAKMLAPWVRGSRLVSSLVPRLPRASPDECRARPYPTRHTRVRGRPMGCFPSSPSTYVPSAQRVIEYWFGSEFLSMMLAEMHDDDMPSGVTKWFGGGPEVDTDIQEKFAPDVQAIAAGQLDSWQQETRTCLAGIVLMDQFTRNMFRGTKHMYSLDDKAREWAATLLHSKDFARLHPAAKLTVALPFMHAEDMESQQTSIDILDQGAAQVEARFGSDCVTVRQLRESAVYGQKHKDVIAKWGRFPHRNAILGRESTPEEAAALKQDLIPSF